MNMVSGASKGSSNFLLGMDIPFLQRAMHTSQGSSWFRTVIAAIVLG